MKIMIALVATLIGVTVKAQSTQVPRELEIYCYESAILPDAKETYFVEIQSQLGRAADYVKVGTASTADSSRTKVKLEQSVKGTKGSMADGEVIYFLSEFPKDGYMNYLSILYPWGTTRSNRLPSVYVGVKNGKHFSVALNCTHMKPVK